MKTTATTLAAALLLAVAIGCEEPSMPAATPPVSTTVATPAETPPAETPASEPATPLPEDRMAVTDIPRKFNAHDPVQGRRSRRAAQEGASFGVGATAAAGFYAKHQSMILAIDQANQLYAPQHDFNFPKTQEEFMKQVVALALNGIPLPELPDDEEYCYVPSQPEEGLQIRLKPGSPRSKVPAGTSPEDAIQMLTSDEPAADEHAAGEPADDTAAKPAEEEPSPDIRTRASQLGRRRNENVEEEQGRALAPGGLVPAGGLGEGEF